ncbi:two-component system sensor histidine kinase NtrB [Bacillus pinisoli]|uniref:two-component system sensor histidine kinase NtrB n=1 Tax=Bacillus pinisoli TaxID=2901866 RepID=UPI001FF48683|nr:ATP-binding protein [Bacillus pinisoli]
MSKLASSRIYLIGLTVTALVCFYYHISIPNLSTFLDWLFFFLLVVIILLTNHYKIYFPPKGNSLSTDTAIYLASIYLYGIEYSLALLLVTSFVFALYWRKAALWKHLFNFNMYIFLLIGAFYSFTLTGGIVGLTEFANILPYITSLLSYYVINFIILGLYFHFASGGSAFQIFKELLKDTYSTYLVIFSLAIILTILLQSHPFMGLLIFGFVMVSLSLILIEYQTLYEEGIKDKAYREHIFNSLPIGVVTIDDYQSSVTLNQNSKTILGLEPDDIKKGEKKEENEDFWRFVSSGENLQNVKLPYKGDQDYLLLASQSTLLNQYQQNIGKILSFIDITETEELQKRIHQSEKLALLGELSAGAAHEIRNPLTVIQGFLSLIYEDFSEEKRNQYQLPLLLKEFERINSIIEEMLLLAKPGAPVLIETYLADIVEEIIPLFGQENIQFDVQLDRTLLLLDTKQMTQVVYNLIRNSCEAIGETTQGTITIYSKVLHDAYELYIQDTGSGIPEELQKKIFEPFLTLKESGTGLGLTIVQRIIENHLGSIKLVSSQTNGTTFMIRLPRPTAN